jgi:hypothetical protein
MSRIILTPANASGSVSLNDRANQIPVDLYLALKGPKGEDGDPGSGGGSGSFYEHTQSSASADWEVEHNLGKKPSVTVIDSGGDLVLVTPTYVNDNTLTLHFSAPFSGVAYCN